MSVHHHGAGYIVRKRCLPHGRLPDEVRGEELESRHMEAEEREQAAHRHHRRQKGPGIASFPEIRSSQWLEEGMNDSPAPRSFIEGEARVTPLSNDIHPERQPHSSHPIISAQVS